MLTVGGDYNGTRINEILIPVIKLPEIVPTIGRLFDLWKEQRSEGEKFGDWSYRVGVDKLRELLAAEPVAG